MSERFTFDELESRARGACPAAGWYRHYKSGKYLVTGAAVRESDGVPLVLYEPYESPLTFARPAAEWGEEVEWEGRRVPRYEWIL